MVHVLLLIMVVEVVAELGVLVVVLTNEAHRLPWSNEHRESNRS